MQIEVTQCGMCTHYDNTKQYCEVWEQYITNDAFYCACGVKADRKTENSSEIPNNCEEPQTEADWKDQMWAEAVEASKDEPQTERSSE